MDNYKAANGIVKWNSLEVLVESDELEKKAIAAPFKIIFYCFPWILRILSLGRDPSFQSFKKFL